LGEIIKTILLDNGGVIYIDDEDYEWLAQYKWGLIEPAVGYKYAGRWENHKLVLMHRFILHAESWQKVDHKNGNGLDNRRCNIRLCTHAENMRNRKRSEGCGSRYKGVTKKQTGWEARIKIDGKTKHLGVYTTQLAAAFVYNKAALKYHGEFARLNPIHQIAFHGTQQI